MSGPSDAARAALLRVSAAVAARDAAGLERALRAAAEAAEPLAVEEVLLQAHLFVGYPLALEALTLWRRVSGTPPPAGLDEDASLWAARGPEVCRTVYGRNYPKLRRNVESIHPDLDRWMVETGYGRVIGRPGLDLATRELCIVALLAAWDAPRQLHSHLRGALNAGADPADVAEALDAATELAPERAARARSLWAEIAPA